MGAFLYRPQVTSQPPAPLSIRWGHPLTQKLIFSTYNAASDWRNGPVNYCNNKPATSTANVTSDTGPLGYAVVPKANGTTAIAKATLDLSVHRRVSFSWWAYWDANANDNKTIWGYGSANWITDSGIIVIPNEASGSFLIGVSEGNVGAFITNTFTRPSAAAWHHYGLVLDRNAASTVGMVVYVDGVSQTLSGSSTFLGNTSFGATQVLDQFGGRSSGGAQLFGAGRIACFNVWGGRMLSGSDFRQMRANSMQILSEGEEFYGTPDSAASSFRSWFIVQ